MEQMFKSIHDMWLLSMFKNKGLPIKKGALMDIPNSDPSSFELSLPSFRRILLLPGDKFMVAT